MAESISVSVPVMMPRTLAISAMLLHVEVVRLAGVNAVPLGQELRDLALGVGASAHRAGRDQDGVDVVELGALQPLADRRVRHEHDVVLVLADHVGPFASQHADDAERDVLDADRLADRVGGLKELGDDVWPMTQTLAAEVMSRSVKKPPLAQRPVADGEVVGADAEHLAGL